MAGKNKKEKEALHIQMEKVSNINISKFDHPYLLLQSFFFFLDCIGNEKEPTLDHLEPPYQSWTWTRRNKKNN